MSEQKEPTNPEQILIDALQEIYLLPKRIEDHYDDPELRGMLVGYKHAACLALDALREYRETTEDDL